MLNHAAQFTKAGIPQNIIDVVSAGSASSINAVAGQLSDAQLSLVRDAVMDGLSKMWIFYTCLLFVGLLSSLGIGRVELSKQHEEHQTGLANEEANRLANEKRNPDQERAEI